MNKDHSNGKCEVCMETITNPVCPSCYKKELLLFLEDKKRDWKLKKFVIKKVEGKFFETNNSAKCIICGKEKVSLCTYCFFSASENLLRQMGISKRILEEYRETFNYPLMKDYFLEENLLKIMH